MLNMYDSVAVKNITKARRMYRYNYSEDKRDYWFDPGQVIYYPRFLAEHFADGIIDDWINENPRYLQRMNNAAFRAELRNKILVGEQKAAFGKIQTAEDLAIAQSQSLNQAPAVTEPVSATPELEEEFAEAKQEPTVAPENTPESPFNNEVEASLSDPKRNPTKDDLIAFARDSLKMNVDDDKFKTMIEGASTEALAIALGYGQ